MLRQYSSGHCVPSIESLVDQLVYCQIAEVCAGRGTVADVTNTQVICAALLVSCLFHTCILIRRLSCMTLYRMETWTLFDQESSG